MVSLSTQMQGTAARPEAYLSGPYSSSSAVPSLLLCTSTVRMYLVAVLMGVACSAACYEGKAAAARAATRRLVPPPPTMTTPLL